MLFLCSPSANWRCIGALQFNSIFLYLICKYAGFLNKIGGGTSDSEIKYKVSVHKRNRERGSRLGCCKNLR